MYLYETVHNGFVGKRVRIFSGSSLVPHGTMGIHATRNPEGRAFLSRTCTPVEYVI